MCDAMCDATALGCLCQLGLLPLSWHHAKHPSEVDCRPVTAWVPLSLLLSRPCHAYSWHRVYQGLFCPLSETPSPRLHLLPPLPPSFLPSLLSLLRLDRRRVLPPDLGLDLIYLGAVLSHEPGLVRLVGILVVGAHGLACTCGGAQARSQLGLWKQTSRGWKGTHIPVTRAHGPACAGSRAQMHSQLGSG